MSKKWYSFKRGVYFFAAVCMIGIGCEKPTDDDDNNGGPDVIFNEELYNLRLTEIHYNPSDLDNTIKSDSLEFIEIKNTGSTTLNLGGLVFTDGIDYTFADSTMLPPDNFFVIASSENGFKQRYGVAPDGVYSGMLKNSGETITLMDTAMDSVIFSKYFVDTLPWPSEADGKGNSLVPVDVTPDFDANGPNAWRKSARMHGSPGADDIIKTVDEMLLNLRITEIHYNPLDLDGTDGDSIEFIELKNIGSTEVALGTVEFTNGVLYVFPADAKIGAGDFIVLTSDLTMFSRRYPDVTPFGKYVDQLANTGEKLTLTDIASDTDLVVVDFKDSSPWPKVADGDGYSIVPISITPDRAQDNPATWRRSRKIHGSPGADDPGIVLVNEVSTHTDLPQRDAVELYNPGDEPVDVSGWFLTDRKVDPVKFCIPSGTVIPAGGYIYFTDSLFNADPSSFASFNFNAHGEEVYLSADSSGCLGYCHGFTFGEIENGVSVGRYITSKGKEVFIPLKDNTFGSENSGPLVGPLMITEIMYHSVDNAGDFIEVTNISGQEVKLYHPDHPDTTWKVNGIGFRFLKNSVIKSNESVIIATDSIPVNAFRIRYSIPDTVQVFVMNGGLKNGSEKLELLKPEDPYVADSTKSTVPVYPYMLFDEVEYSDGNSWPLADGNGLSLHRKSGTYGDDPVSWEAKSPSPGSF